MKRIYFRRRVVRRLVQRNFTQRHIQSNTVTVKRQPLPRRGDAVCVFGCPQKCIETLSKVQQMKESTLQGERQRDHPRSFFEKETSIIKSSSFALVLASCDTALRA